MHQRSGWADKFRNFLRHMYVERQIYIRSHGHVQFISLSPLTQTVFATIAFVFLSWIAFSSVNVVFKEQIIAAKDRRYVKMQSAYEERMAQLQSAYDELNGQLVITEERFLATTRQLEDKHKQLSALMSQRQTAGSQLDTMRRRYAATLRGQGNAESSSNTVLMRVDEASEGADIVPTSERPQKAAELDRFFIEATDDGAVFDIAGLAGAESNQNGTVSQIDTRLSRLDTAQQGLINNVEEITDRRVRELKSIIAMTKVIDPDDLLKRGSKARDDAQGGPFISLADADALAGGDDETAFQRQLFRVSQNLKKMADLEDSIARMPLAEPLVSYRKTSSYGARRDPFNGRMAFHSGEDMAASYGALIFAPGAGTVSYAGWKGGYGRVIEIDHGNGFRTRYGHLGKIDVKAGQKIAFREVIGKVGSSGRSSGPHLHYEVWFDGIVRNPSKFIEAGHYVFAKQG
ncbi:peptidase M23B [Parvibaculum lavamentivorans DS-1]|uniref:Peptidase M23B n=1 Tax=Parvibaculum lavamentivorans (strain DS-1 / DSM 13023 / NCIMB 13966) TaxID=402881 RepID=A7HY94_PARL1|nr:peptidoglycan DD-metalloendopeptidase family protein [Parvibaculum lavamentivorans]ABS64877.1 peptidase M23B [Parvibaculum lavamentivorans DS-1]